MKDYQRMYDIACRKLDNLFIQKNEVGKCFSFTDLKGILNEAKLELEAEIYERIKAKAD